MRVVFLYGSLRCHNYTFKTSNTTFYSYILISHNSSCTYRGALFILKNWPPFAIGVCIYFIYGQKNKAASLVLLLVSSLALIKNFMLNNELPYFIATVIATVLICLGLKYKLKNNTFSKLGDYSYSVYLLHVPLGAFLMGHYKTPVIQQNIYFNIGYDTVTYLLTLGAAYLSFKFIELPSIKAGKQFSQKLSGKKVKLINQD
jgi:peptidoglycan/LPS O-acetylase OafA/YrhL